MTLKKWGVRLVALRFELYQIGLQYNTLFFIATGDPSLSAAGFQCQSLSIPPWRVAQAPLLSCQAAKDFPPHATFPWVAVAPLYSQPQHSKGQQNCRNTLCTFAAVGMKG